MFTSIKLKLPSIRKIGSIDRSNNDLYFFSFWSSSEILSFNSDSVFLLRFNSSIIFTNRNPATPITTSPDSKRVNGAMFFKSYSWVSLAFNISFSYLVIRPHNSLMRTIFSLPTISKLVSYRSMKCLLSLSLANIVFIIRYCLSINNRNESARCFCGRSPRKRLSSFFTSV